jgi:hypothetical protein
MVAPQPAGELKPPSGVKRAGRESRRRYWLHGCMVVLGVALVAVAVIGLIGSSPRSLIDRPGRVVKVRAASGSWHLAWIAIPNVSTERITERLSTQVREKWQPVEETVGQSHRQLVSRFHVMWSDMHTQQNIAAGKRAYATDLWRARVRPATSPNLPEPTVWIVGLPAWVFALPGFVCLLIPARAARKHRQRLKWLRYCRGCAYDLTGNTSGSCPECGLPLPAEMTPPPVHVESSAHEMRAFPPD